jgi:hypothetical protein
LESQDDGTLEVKKKGFKRAQLKSFKTIEEETKERR